MYHHMPLQHFSMITVRVDVIAAMFVMVALEIVMNVAGVAS